MKLHHIVVIAVAVLGGCAQAQTGPGSLLMLPPLTAGGYADKNAPLSKWQTFEKYDGLTDCKSARTSYRFAVGSQVGQISRAAVPSEAEAVEMMSAECVAGDDPRLAGN